MSNIQVLPKGNLSNQLSSSERQKIYYGFLRNYSSINTRKAYRDDLEYFLKFLAQGGGKKKNSLSKRSMNRKIACLGAFYSHLFDLGYITSSPTAKIKRFKIEKEVVTQDIGNENVQKIFASIDRSNGSALLHYAILKVLFSTGMRQGELRELKFKNLQYEKNFLCFKYTAKGGRELLTPINQDCLDSMGDYFEWCESNGYSFDSEDYIFRPTKNSTDGNLNKKLNPGAVDYIFKKYARGVGIKGNVTAHSARATVIGKLLDQDVSIDRVADFVGYRDISTTKSYNKRKRNVEDSLSFVVKYD